MWQKKDSLEFAMRQKTEERWVSDKEAKQCSLCLTEFSLTIRKVKNKNIKKKNALFQVFQVKNSFILTLVEYIYTFEDGYMLEIFVKFQNK